MHASKRRQQESQEDHHPPDTNKRMFTTPRNSSSRKKANVKKTSWFHKTADEKAALTGILQRYQVAALSRSITGTSSLPQVQDTCAFDSMLFVLYFLQRNNILQRGFPGYDHPDSKASEIFALLDESQGDKARRLLLHETYKQARDDDMVASLQRPGFVSAWSGGSDFLSVLLHKMVICVSERVGCSACCAGKNAWREKTFPYHSVKVTEFPDNLEVYMKKRLFGYGVRGKGKCTLSINQDIIQFLDVSNREAPESDDDEFGTKLDAKLQSGQYIIACQNILRLVEGRQCSTRI